ncbi:MAG: hypothetical protein U1E95_04990 [Rubrivivax sp.]
MVALAVMAFGMLAVVGVQATLRYNADVARQRSEAVRLGQEAIESDRAFSVLGTPDSDHTSFATIADGTETVTGFTTNTTYTITRTVAEPAGAGRKDLRLAVTWPDRSGETQTITLDTIIGAFDPRVALLLGARPNGIPPWLPQGRSPLVPQGQNTRDLGDGRTAYQPGGMGTTVWLFDNSTGAITSECTFPGTDLSQLMPASQCAPKPSVMISGFVRFSFGPSPDAAAPADTALTLAVRAKGSSGFTDGQCFAFNLGPPATFTAYVCVVPTGTVGWTGTVKLVPPLDLSTQSVCRYVNALPGNPGHPQEYTALKTSLPDQNYLVIDKTAACPTGTAAHQPPVTLP